MDNDTILSYIIHVQEMRKILWPLVMASRKAMGPDSVIWSNHWVYPKKANDQRSTVRFFENDRLTKSGQIITLNGPSTI